jgi:hypothetical protein
MAGRVRGAAFDPAVEHASRTRSSSGLCPPLLLAGDAVDDSRASALAVWGVFNPFGSSRVRLLAVEIDRPGDELLLVHEVSHPRHPRATAHGLLSGPPGPLLRELLAERAIAGKEPVLPAPPTHVDLPASVLGEGELRSLLCESLASRAELDLEACCSLIEEHGADVKERTKDELRVAIGIVMDRHAGIRRTPGPPTREALARWWSLVTDAELGAGERAAIDELGSGHLRVRPPLQA